MKLIKLTLTLVLLTTICLACTKDDENLDPTPETEETTNTEETASTEETMETEETEETMETENDEVIFLESLETQTITGNISDGQPMDDLAWAWTSSMACFVTPGKHFYTGNQVFYKIDMPTQSVLTVKLTPTDSGSKMGLYGYSKGLGTVNLPPNITSCVSCEADPSNNNGTETGVRDIELRATTNPYTAIICVSGGDDLAEGAFSLEINIAN